MLNAFIFPGQGSQYVGMGFDLYNEFEDVQKRYEQANEILGYNLSEISFFGPKEKLRETQFTQPAIFIHSIIMDDLLKLNGIKPAAVAGRSLGEISALVSAEILSFTDALLIVKVRSNAMANANKINPGSMAAIIGANNKEIEMICNQNGIVLPANLNSPKQIVISGEKDAINHAIITARKLGVKLAKELNVSGAFHSPLMKSARKPLKEVINSVNFKDAKVPIYQNVNAKPETDIIKIRKNLLNQLESPVLWVETINSMVKNDLLNFFEVGPGKILNKLNYQINNNIKTQNIDKMEHLNTYAIL